MRRILFRIFIVLVLIGAVGYGAFLVLQQQKGMFVAPKFMAARQEVASLLKQLSETPDINLMALDKYDKDQNWQAALDALENAGAQNSDALTLVRILTARTGDVSDENQKIGDVTLRKLGESALGALRSGNETMLQYFKLRGDMLEIMRLYYFSLAGSRKTSAPDFTQEFKNVNILSEAAQNSYAEFNSAMASFDKAAGIE